MAAPHEIDAMRLAISLSARGLGTTSPNPPVGCVILDANGDIVGTGYHERKGEPHAEANALAASGDRAAGGTAIVTLEPCNHVGRTPACRQALLDARVARVVIAVIDPTSRGEGGAAVLRAAGVDVEVGVLADEARTVLGPWLTALRLGRPVVTAAYVAGDQRKNLLEGLRAATDAVLFENNTLEEGVPGTHGAGAFTLPTHPIQNSPTDLLQQLYAGGVRTLLLAGGIELATRYATESLVDRVIAIVPDETSRHGVLPGFEITRVTREADSVIVESERSESA
jgi:diaminohydroxyphosphoribosylaminopyrimidine deaminase/5-amino-6-(5-phosphoribosylamino)uracil reductase